MSRRVIETVFSPDLRPAGSVPLPAKAMSRHRPLVHLTRQYLRLALPVASRHQRALRGDDLGDVVVATRIETDLRFALSLRYVATGVWQITATVAPPPIGWLLLTIGEELFRARFDAQGNALVPDVPDILLAAQDGPDLDIAIELESAPGAAPAEGQL
jgi:hypothetical protein